MGNPRGDHLRCRVSDRSTQGVRGILAIDDGNIFKSEGQGLVSSCSFLTEDSFV
jgi:hypothetical protein